MRAVVNDGSLHSHRNGVDRGDCRCPCCRQTVSRDELIEIQVRQDELVSEIEERVKDRLIAERDVEIEKVRQETAAAIEAAEQAIAKREAVIRKEAAAAANAAVAPKLAEAAAAKKAAEEQAKASKAAFEATLKERLAAQDETVARARVEAVNAVTEKFFGENLRLQERVLELQRMLDKKQPQERGDIFETDIVEALMAEFPQDQVACERVKKGKNGSDIAVRVFHPNGTCVGTIAVECKSVQRYSSAWVPKLRADMITMGAAYGVLTTAAFPQGENQLAVRDGVIIAHPARLVAVIGILRRAIIALNSFRLTQEERDEKMAAVYRLMISDRASSRWDRMSEAAAALVEIETSDAVHQDRVRTKRLGLIHAVQAVHSEFVGDLDGIIRGEPEDLL